MSGGHEDILVVTADAAAAAAVDGALGSNGRSWLQTRAQSLREVPFHLGRSSIPVVLVDLDPNPAYTLGELDRIVARFPGTRFVALSNAMDQELLLTAMQSGVRQVLLKQNVRSELVPLLYRLVSATAPQAVDRGEVFVVLSAGGGCGATTLAVNLADELAARAGRPSLLIDLDLAYGSLAAVLGIEPKYGIDHVLSYEGTVDTHLINSTASPFSPNIHVLPGPVGTGFASPERVEFGRLGQVLDVATQAYRNVVVDAPRVQPEVAAALVAAATRVLLTMQLTVKDVRVARAMLAALGERGVPADGVVPVVNRYAKRQHSVGLDDAARALGGAPVHCVRNDYQAAARAMDFGQTLATSSPRSPLRRDVQELVSKIAATAPAGAR